MEERGNNKDALLEKLDNLMRSGRAPKRPDPPPLLTETIPKASESTIPTLTDVVSSPDTIPDAGSNTDSESPEQEVGTEARAPLELEPDSPDDSDRNEPLEFERIEGFAKPQQTPKHLDQQPPASEPDATPDDSGQNEFDDASEQRTLPVLHESISERLLDVLDQEMTSLLKELPAEKSKLSVLHRSLRFALPELVRLRWLESPAGGADEAHDGDSEAED